MKKVEKNHINELLFTVYLYLFSLMKIFTTNFPSISTQLLLGSTLIILVISLFHNKMRFSKKFISLLAISIFVILFEILTRSNNQTLNYVYDYVIYGVITAFLYSYVTNKEIIIKYYANISILVFLILFLDPLYNYKMTETYMVFGYSMLPAFLGMYLGWLYLNKKWIIPFVIVAFIQLIFFANRGAILTALIIILLLYLNKLSTRKLNFNFIMKQISLFFITIIGAFFIAINAYKIVESLYQFLVQKGYFSYALFTLTRTLRTGDVAFEMSTRDVIHDSAWEFIGNNLMFGNGIGAFHDYYGIYSHNLILDILATFGVIGFIIFLILFIKSIQKLLTSSGYDRLFGILIVSLATIPLWFSMNFFVSKEFWVLIMMGLGSIKESTHFKYSKMRKMKQVNHEV